jgi:hypothetical protein
MTEIPDEILMAFADDELEPEARRAVVQAMERDPALVLRLEPFLRTGRSLRNAFSAVFTAPQAAADLVERQQSVTRFEPPRPSLLAWLSERLGAPQWSVAAVPGLALGLLCGAAGVWLSSAPDGAMLREGGKVASAVLQGALEKQVSGSAGELASITPTSTFRNQKDGWCRTYELNQGAARRYEGVACLEPDARWHIEIQKEVRPRAPASPGTYVPAGREGDPAVEAVVDKLIKGSLLRKEEEAGRLREGFRPPR